MNKLGPPSRRGQRKTCANRQRYWFFIHYLKQTGEPARPEVGEAFPSTKLRRLEAALFLAKDGLSSRKLAQLAGLADATEARTLIRQLNQTYDEHGRAFRVEEIAGGYAMLTRPQFAGWLRRLGHIPGERRLSQSAMETLSIVAYRQPVLRADVEAIRGVGCSEVLKQLMELDLVRISGRSEELGRPYLYGTTRRFLQMFGLRSVDRLPRVSWVNEPAMSLTPPDLVDTNSEEEEPAVTHSLAATALLEEEQTIPAETEDPKLAIDDDDDGWMDEGADDWDEDDEDEEWDDDEDDDEDDADDEDDDLDEDELEDDGEWEEVGDDDDGWVEEGEDDEEDDDDDDDDWGDDEDEDWD